MQATGLDDRAPDPGGPAGRRVLASLGTTLLFVVVALLLAPSVVTPFRDRLCHRHAIDTKTRPSALAGGVANHF